MNNDIDPRVASSKNYVQKTGMHLLHINASMDAATIDEVTSLVSSVTVNAPLFAVLSPPYQPGADTSVPEFLDIVTEVFS